MGKSLEIPGSAVATSDPVSPRSGSIQGSCGLQKRTLPNGALPGQVYDVGEVEFTVAPGAPGSTTVDLSVNSLDGTPIVGLAGKLVYLEMIVETGIDAQWKVAAANAVTLASGVTDSINVYGSVKLVDYRDNPGYTAFTPPLFDATHKNIVVTSTGGCTGRFLVAVI